MTRWLDRHGLSAVANVVDTPSAQGGNVDALHAMARRAIASREWEQAATLLHNAIELNPKDASLFCSLGAVHRWQGNFLQARADYDTALRLKPEYLQVFSNLGEWCLAQDNAEEALTWLDRALHLQPTFFEARLNQTAALLELGRLPEALELAQRLSDDVPDSPEACLNLGNILLLSGKGRPAIKLYLKALEIRPGYAEASLNLATLLGNKEDLGRSIAFLEQRLKEREGNLQTLGMLAAAYYAVGRIADSEACSHKVLLRQPENVLALGALANCRSASGDAAGAMLFYEKLLKADPTQWAMGSNSLFEANNRPDLSREEVFELHSAWARALEEKVQSLPGFAERDRSPGRKLRIGYVSGDFVNHPVGNLLRDIFQHHDAEAFSVHCFSMEVRPQEVLPELRKAADSWHDIFMLSDEEVASLIEETQIDILVDLSGHTAFHRLQTFARKPAPIQVEWIGYFHSTGLTAIDYFITDPHTSPFGSGQLFSEIPVWLPATRFCFAPPPYAPAVVAGPAASSGHITFGSFNRLSKLTDEAVAAWSAILSGVPGSRLVLKSAAFTEPLVVERIQGRFAAHGIASDRLDLRENSPHGEMLVQYGDIDIALDTFPFNGGMTSLEAAWMGVPVVTIAGSTVVSRQTVSVLANIGLADDLAFPDVARYVEGALRLANDTDRLASLRAGMRERMQQSPLRDAPQFTRDLEALFRRMWVGWCNGTKLPSAIDQKP